MRARYPDHEDYAERDGVRLFYEVHGDGSPTLVLVPCVSGADSRAWKGQVPYLARGHRVVAYDPRGRGRSDRPPGPEAYTAEQHARDLLQVMAATDTDEALVVCDCIGSRPALRALTAEPHKFIGAAFISPYLFLTDWPPAETMWRFFEHRGRARRMLSVIGGLMRAVPAWIRLSSMRRFARRVRWFEGGRKFNAAHWLSHQRDFLEWNARVLELTEPHSTKQIEDSIAWGMETDARTLVDSYLGLDIRDETFHDREWVRDLCAQVACPVLVIHGQNNLACPPEWGASLAGITGGELRLIDRCGHLPQARKPVAVNLALQGFIGSVAGATGKTDIRAATEPELATTQGGTR